MKWNTLIGSLVLGIAVSSPGYGAGLLDRILHTKGCGCETKPVQKSKPAPKCGAEKTKSKKGKPKRSVTKQKHVAKSKSKSKGGNLLQDLADHLGLNLVHTSKSKPTPKQKRVAKPKPKCGTSKQKHVSKPKSKPKCGVTKHKRVALPRPKGKSRSTGANSQPTAAGARISPVPPAPVVDPSAFLNRRDRVATASFTR